MVAMLLIGIIIVSIIFLQMFDRIAGRGPGQISEGMREYEEWKKYQNEKKGKK